MPGVVREDGLPCPDRSPVARGGRGLPRILGPPWMQAWSRWESWPSWGWRGDPFFPVVTWEGVRLGLGLGMQALEPPLQVAGPEVRLVEEAPSWVGPFFSFDFFFFFLPLGLGSGGEALGGGWDARYRTMHVRSPVTWGPVQREHRGAHL